MASRMFLQVTRPERVGDGGGEALRESVPQSMLFEGWRGPGGGEPAARGDLHADDAHLLSTTRGRSWSEKLWMWVSAALRAMRMVSEVVAVDGVEMKTSGGSGR